MHCCCAQVQVKGGKTVTLGVWDTAGAEQFESLSRMYYRCCALGALCVCLCVSFQKRCGACSSCGIGIGQCRVQRIDAGGSPERALSLNLQGWTRGAGLLRPMLESQLPEAAVLGESGD